MWGGSLSSFSVSRVVSVSERFSGDNHNRLRQIEESGSAALLDLAMSHPPCERVTNCIGRCDIKKRPILRVFQPVSSRSANRTARHVEHSSIETPSVSLAAGILMSAAARFMASPSPP